jgi:hypothetical protein
VAHFLALVVAGVRHVTLVTTITLRLQRVQR